MRAAGKAMFVKDMVCKYGLMVQNIPDSGSIIKLTVRENLFMWMAISMMANGKRIKHQVTESILIAMALDIKENG